MISRSSRSSVCRSTSPRGSGPPRPGPAAPSTSNSPSRKGPPGPRIARSAGREVRAPGLAGWRDGLRGDTEKIEGVGGAERLQERPPPGTTPRTLLTRAGAPRTVWAQRGGERRAWQRGTRRRSPGDPDRGPPTGMRDQRLLRASARPRGLALPQPSPAPAPAPTPAPAPRNLHGRASRMRARTSPNFLPPSAPCWGVCPRRESPVFVQRSPPPPGPPPSAPPGPRCGRHWARSRDPWALGRAPTHTCPGPLPEAGRLPDGGAGVLAVPVRSPAAPRPYSMPSPAGAHSTRDRSALGPLGASYARAAHTRLAPRAPRALIRSRQSAYPADSSDTPRPPPRRCPRLSSSHLPPPSPLPPSPPSPAPSPPSPPTPHLPPFLSL